MPTGEPTARDVRIWQTLNAALSQAAPPTREPRADAGGAWEQQASAWIRVHNTLHEVAKEEMDEQTYPVGKPDGSMANRSGIEIAVAAIRELARKAHAVGATQAEGRALERIAKALKHEGGSPDKLAENVEWLLTRYSEMCTVLREAVHRHNLGLGGEKIDTLVVNELDRLRAARSSSVGTTARREET